MGVRAWSCSRCQRFVMSTFRQCRRVHTAAWNLQVKLSKCTRILRPKQRGNCLSQLAVTVHLHQSHRVIIHMNTKMILAAVALSLSLAACAKKEEPAEAAQDAAATASEAAGTAQDAAGDAAAAAGDAAAAAGDAALPPAETPPAEQPPASRSSNRLRSLSNRPSIDERSSSSGYRAGSPRPVSSERSLPRR